MTCPSLSGSWMSRRPPLLPPKQDHHHHWPTSPLHGLYSSSSAQNQQFSLVGVNDDLSRPFLVSDLLCFFLQLRLNFLSMRWEGLPKYPVKQSNSSTATSSTTRAARLHTDIAHVVCWQAVFLYVLTSELIAIIPGRGGGDAKPIQHRSFYGFMVHIGPSSSATCKKYS